MLTTKVKLIWKQDLPKTCQTHVGHFRPIGTTNKVKKEICALGGNTIMML